MLLPRLVTGLLFVFKALQIVLFVTEVHFLFRVSLAKAGVICEALVVILVLVLTGIASGMIAVHLVRMLIILLPVMQLLAGFV